jgi:hypothetical protein
MKEKQKIILLLLVGIIVLLLVLFICKRFFFNNTREAFVWNDTSKQSFIVTQHSMNPQIIFDTDTLQQQASQEEVDYFNENKKWPWSSSTTQLYETAINKNPYIRTYSGDAVNYAQTIYNETAILSILENQRKTHTPFSS